MHVLKLPNSKRLLKGTMEIAIDPVLPQNRQGIQSQFSPLSSTTPCHDLFCNRLVLAFVGKRDGLGHCAVFQGRLHNECPMLQSMFVLALKLNWIIIYQDAVSFLK